ncbi:MAG TPA: PIN domain-containing protein [Opitutaceae bacterium]|nr:PIN domain-containing protein [Opitutaceae bacterium]
MDKTLLSIRLAFVTLCAAAGWLVSLTLLAGDRNRVGAIMVGFFIGALVVLVDMMLKGFSLRGLSALTFGIGVGLFIAYMVGESPLLEQRSVEGGDGLDPRTVYMVRIGLFVICPYLAAVIALRGKDEFNLIIPYVRFVPHEVDVPLVVVDTSVLIDGRVARLCETGFMSAALIIPRFVLDELQSVADSSDPHRQARGRRGLEILGELRKIKNIDIRITDSEVAKSQHVDAKLVFLAQSMRAKLLTTDYNLAKLAEFHGVPWLNLNQLAKALRPELLLGETLEVDLVKPGKEETQAVGFLEDGSMVVVNSARAYIGKRVSAEIMSVLPSAGGKMVFARMLSPVE